MQRMCFIAGKRNIVFRFFYELAAFFFSFMVLCTFFFFLCVRVCVYVCVSSCVSGMHVYHFFQLSRLSFFQRRSLYM